MKQKHQVFNLIILDESGSMSSIKSATIEGFNEVVQTVKGVQEQYPEQAHFISLVTFNGLGIKTLLYNEPVEKLNQLDANQYRPNASTPLFDAMGNSLNRLKYELVERSNYNVLVTIITDGEENASKEFNGKTVKKLVSELKNKNWTFTYIGANHDVEKFADSISINNTLSFQASISGMKKMFSREKKARMNYIAKVSRNEETADNYFEED